MHRGFVQLPCERLEYFHHHIYIYQDAGTADTELAFLIACAEGLYSCPVTGKVFTEHTHIVAVRPTGNVYANDAVRTIGLSACYNNEYSSSLVRYGCEALVL